MSTRLIIESAIQNAAARRDRVLLEAVAEQHSEVLGTGVSTEDACYPRILACEIALAVSGPATQDKIDLLGELIVRIYKTPPLAQSDLKLRMAMRFDALVRRDLSRGHARPPPIALTPPSPNPPRPASRPLSRLPPTTLKHAVLSDSLKSRGTCLQSPLRRSPSRSPSMPPQRCAQLVTCARCARSRHTVFWEITCS